MGGFRVFGGVFCVALFCHGAAAELYPIAKISKAPPTWWGTPEFHGTNPGLDDGNDPDDMPDGWTTHGYVEEYSPGMYLLGKDAGVAPPNGQTGSLVQLVGNLEDKSRIKQVAIKIEARGDSTKASALRVSAKGPDPDGSGSVSDSRGLSIPTDDVTRYVTLRLDRQPKEEWVTVECVETGIDSDTQVHPVVVDTIDIRTRCIDLWCGNVRKGKPLAASNHTSNVTYDVDSQTLSFGDCLIDTLNLDGSDAMDPVYSADPILGATVSIGDFKLIEQRGDGWYFEGGTYQISRGTDIFLQARLPWLWVNDEDAPNYQENVFGEFFDFQIDRSLGSAWLEEYALAFEQSPFWAEFRAKTGDDIEGWFAETPGSGEVHSTTSTVLTGFCTPEPGSLWLLGIGVSGLAVSGRMRRA